MWYGPAVQAGKRHEPSYMREMYPMKIGRQRQVLTADAIFDLVRDDLHNVEKAIDIESYASVDTVSPISKYLQQNSGERLRAALLLLCARLAGGSGNRMAIQLGAVVEMLQAASLVHSEVVDVDQACCERPSPGLQSCVLAGDWLYLRAFRVALQERVLDLAIDAAQRMVMGELIQINRIGSVAVTEADYIELVDCKTARLFSLCGKLGATAAGSDKRDGERLAEFAWNLGMAFQLIDDMLDFTSCEQTLGKPVGGDLKEGKITLPLVYALEAATAAERSLVENVLEARSYAAVPFADILALVERHSGIQRTRERAQQFTSHARQIVSEFPGNPYQRALFTLTDLVTARDR